MKKEILHSVHPESNFWIAPVCSYIDKMTVISQFMNILSSPSFLTLSCLFFLSLVTGPSFIPISLPVLELSQFSFIKDWPEIWKLEIPSFEYCLISRYWGKVGIAHLVWIFLITCYWMMQNVKITVFAVVKLLREKHRNSWMNL